MSSDDDMSLDELVDAFIADADYALGLRPSPRGVSPDEAVEVVRDIYSGCDQSDTFMPKIAQELGRVIACHDGCPSGCCAQMVLVTLPEALAVAVEVGKPERDAERQLLLLRLREWKERFGARAQDCAQALAEGREEDYKALHHAHAAEFTLCPFSGVEQSCTVYSARPLPCRKLWVLDTWEHCGAPRDGGPGAEVKMLAHPKVDQLYTNAQQVTRGLQSAMGAGTELHPLPLAVLALLEAATAEAPADEATPAEPEA